MALVEAHHEPHPPLVLLSHHPGAADVDGLDVEVGLNQIWSYGGGVQSAAIAALIANGELPAPDFAVIADTGREASTTWKYLVEVVQPALPFRIHRIPHSFDGTGYNTVDLWGGAKKDTLLIPAFTTKTSTEKSGMIDKYCSNEWKSRPIQRFCRDHGMNHGDLWIGFSTDEMQRCRTYVDAEKWNHVYPLIDRRMTRGDCIALVERMGWPPAPKSACWMCPYRSDHEWRDLKENNKEDFIKAVTFENGIQRRDPNVFLHKSGQPLAKVDFSIEPDLFDAPCASGMCFT